MCSYVFPLFLREKVKDVYILTLHFYSDDWTMTSAAHGYDDCHNDLSKSTGWKHKDELIVSRAVQQIFGASRCL